MKNVKYTITEDESIKVERLFHEKNMHNAIITELINTNPNTEVRELPIYKELIDIARDYHRTVDDLIKKYTNGEYDTSKVNWSITFKDCSLSVNVKNND